MKILTTFPGQDPQTVDAPAHLIAQKRRDPAFSPPFIEWLPHEDSQEVKDEKKMAIMRLEIAQLRERHRMLAPWLNQELERR
jgi:hypothetical protein